VTGLVTERCADSDDAVSPPGLTKLLQDARRHLQKAEPANRFPMSLEDFVSETEAGRIRTVTCYEICVSRLMCFVCCTLPDSDELFYCGKKIVFVED
jgi:hypothetical protein